MLKCSVYFFVGAHTQEGVEALRGVGQIAPEVKVFFSEAAIQKEVRDASG